MNSYFCVILILIAKVTGNGNGQLCEQIRVPYCANLTNFHRETIQEAEFNAPGNQQQIILSKYESLFNCSDEMKYFICSALLPSCENSQLKYPCNSFCRRILTSESCQNELREIMTSPEGNEITNIFNCDVLYQESSNQCIRQPMEAQTINIHTNNTQTHTNNSSPFCEDTHYTIAAKHFASTWLVITTIPTILILLFTLLTILINLKAYEYPLQPILYIVLSHVVYCIGVLFRSAIGYYVSSCQNGEIIRGEFWTLEHAPCIIIFITTYFGMMSYLVWTCILTICLVFSKLFQWSDADVAKFRVVFHSLGWSIPTAQTLILMSIRESRTDELTGICSVHVQSRTTYIAGFILPIVVYTIATNVGIVLSLFGIIRTYTRMGFYQKHLEKHTLIRSIIRISIFLFAYTSIFAVFIITTTYDYIAYPSYTEVSCKGVNCRMASPAVGIVTITCILTSGLVSTIWIARTSTYTKWKRTLLKLTRRKRNKKCIQTRLKEVDDLMHNIGEITNLEVKVPGFVDVTHTSSYDEYTYSINSTTTTNKSEDAKNVTAYYCEVGNPASIFNLFNNT
uniref:Frizzled B n=1 Tax=Oopsacas minuta TaxID=111878 RepID=A0A0B5CME8_9METZ|nr:frizzled B [Oopsacas minuta]